MLKRLFREYGRHRPSELAVALNALPPGELARGIVELFAAGELRLHSRKRRSRNPCAKGYRYDKLNPHVFEWFLAAARALKNLQHRTRYAIGALLEKIRWDVSIGIIKTDRFKISNDLQAYYVRKVLMRDPSLCGLFTLKPSVYDAMVVDGRTWLDFAKEHEAELWPERAAKKAAQRVESESLFETESAAS